MSEKDWTPFDGKIPTYGLYEIKINNVELKNVVVKTINTFHQDTKERLNGFVIPRTTEEYDDLRECTGWMSRDDYLFLDPKTITHFRMSSSYDVYRITNNDELQKFYSLICGLKPAKIPKLKARIKSPKTPIGKFNATHSSFDVLVDYAFGGDKQAALEYLKTL